ncbi:MAG: ATP synthase F0 subunit B [Desulfobacterales bacterium]|nr:ATP synthase F0 subunit B [Desulfobacterales bacterium]
MCIKKLAPILITLLILFCAVAMPVFASSGGGHGEAEPKGWVSTDTYRVMNFVALAVGLFLLVRKPVGKALGSRITGIREQISDLENRKSEAEQKLAEYNNRLAQLDSEADKLVAEYIRQGEEARERILKEAEKNAEKLEAQAKRNIEHEFSQAKQKLQDEVLEKALEKAEAIIKAKITADDQEKMVDEYLEKVVS